MRNTGHNCRRDSSVSLSKFQRLRYLVSIFSRDKSFSVPFEVFITLTGKVTVFYILTPCSMIFFVRFVAKKVCTTFSKTNNKIVPLTNLLKCLYSGKSEIKLNRNKSSGV
jgi:hypothetical protein